MAPKIRLDAVAAQAQACLNFDASEANVFARELLKVRAGVFEVKFPELKAMRLIPMNKECGPVDEEFTYRYATEYGTTRPGSSYAGQAPRVDVAMVEATPVRIRPVTASYGFDFQEARVAAKTGNGLPQRKANAARKAIAQELNRILTFGDSTRYGVTLAGLANLSGTHTYSVPNGASGDTEWTTKTPDEILLDLNGIASGIVTNSSGVEEPDTLLLPLARYELIASKRMGDGSDMTVLKHFLGVNPHIKTVESWHALDAAPSSEWTGMRMICYRKDPDVLEAIVPIEFEQFAPQMINMETITSCHARIAGVVAYRPKAISYGDQI